MYVPPFGRGGNVDYSTYLWDLEQTVKTYHTGEWTEPNLNDKD